MKFKEALKKSAFSILKILPMFIAIVWLVGIFQVFVTPKMLSHFFDGAYLHDTITSIVSGSVTIGQVVLSCIVGFALLKTGVTLFGVTVFFFVPTSLITTGLSTPTSEAALITPSAILSHLTIPPNIFIKTTFTFLSASKI
jgi:hypothetical protein